MGLRRNLVFGVASSAVSALAAIAVVPLYLNYLGQEAYGVIGFYTTWQVLLTVLDLGFSTTLNREVAQAHTPEQRRDATRLAVSLERLYVIVGAAIALLFSVASPWLASRWLNVHDLSVREVAAALTLGGMALGARWPIAIHQAVLLGSRRMVTLSLITIAMTLLSTLVSAALIVWLGMGLRGFFVWQLGAGLLQVLLLRAATASSVSHETTTKLDVNQIHRAWKLSTSLGMIGVIALIFLQADKIILSRMLSLQEFSQYMLATLIASGIYMFVTPAFNIVCPHLSVLAVKPNIPEIIRWYRLVSGLLASALFPLGIFLAINGRALLEVWAGNAELAYAVAPILSLLVTGSALHGVMFMPYALAVALGATALALRINAVLLLVFIPLIIGLTIWFGGIGAATAWLILHVIYLVIGSFTTHRRLLPGIEFIWLLLDIGVPLLAALFMGVVDLIIRTSLCCGTRLDNSTLGSILLVITWGALLLRYQPIRQWLWQKLKNKQ